MKDNRFALDQIRLDWLKQWDQETADRLFAKIKRLPSGCWWWVGSCTQRGLPVIELGGTPCSARRVVWEMFYGELDDTQLVQRTCQQPGCINPAHATTVSSALQRPHAKLTPALVIEIRALAERGISHRALTGYFEVDHETIQSIIARRRWADVVQPDVVKSPLFAVLPDQNSGLNDVERRKLAHRLARAGEVLTDREQIVLTRRFGLDDHPTETLQVIAEQLQLSREAVRQIQVRALRALGLPETLATLREFLASKHQ